MNIFCKLILLVVLAGTLFAMPIHAYAAYDVYNGVKCDAGKNDESTVCTDKSNGNDNPLTGNDGLLLHIANIIAYIAGAAAVIIVLLSAIRYITSNGDANGISSARNGILGALIGVAVIVLARALIGFVLSKI